MPETNKYILEGCKEDPISISGDAKGMLKGS